MKPFLPVLVISAASLLRPGFAAAQEYDPPGWDAQPADTSAQADEPSPQPQDWEEQYPAPFDQAPPDAQSAPAPAPPPAASGPPAAAAPAGVPPGQWVWTDQYGWVWMPYADPYTYVPPEGYGAPYMYVYCPSLGWDWLVAPWVWGLGPWPHFGVLGVFHFGWYHHGWWRTPERWHWAGASLHGGSRGGFRHGGGFPSTRTPSSWGGFRSRPAPGFHGGGGRMGGPAFRGGSPAPAGGSHGDGRGFIRGGGWAGGGRSGGGHSGWSGGGHGGWSGGGHARSGGGSRGSWGGGPRGR